MAGFAEGNPVDDIERLWLEVPAVVMAEGGAVKGFIPLDMSGIAEVEAEEGIGPL